VLCLIPYCLLAICYTGRNLDAGFYSGINKANEIVNLYFISGLGVDKRVFCNLTLSPGFSIHYIDWIKPMDKESITNYAKRLCTFIDKTKPFVLIGLSFGGIMAVEMNRFLQPEKTIIISSAATKNQLPKFIRSIRFMPIYKLLPNQFLKKANGLFYWFFGIKTDDEKKLLKQILPDTDIDLLKWSIHEITHWQNETIPSNLIHIHGDADKLLPIKHTNANIKIRGGEHFMIHSKASEISKILNEVITHPQL